MLDEIADEFGGQSAAICEGIRTLADQSRRRQALREFLDELTEQNGPPDPDEAAGMGRRYFNK